MGEKLIIDDTPQPEVEEEMEGEILLSSSHDYITSAVQALDALDGFDTALVSKADERRVNRIKRQSLKLLSFYINELYDETFESSVDSDND